MGLFSRKSSEPAPTVSPVHPVTAFWAWWRDEGHRLSPREASTATDELTRLLGAVDPSLSGHFGPGVTAEHRLTVSAGGVADGRPSAERWFRAAPAPDATWEFSPRQEADPGALSHRLEIAGATVDLSETRFSVAPDARVRRVDIGVHHPAFAALPEQVCGQVTFLVLDWLLGEDEVARWLGAVEPLPGAPRDAVRRAVADLAARRDPDEWVLAEWSDGELPGLASFRPWLHWLDDPLWDRYHALSVAYDARPDGLPPDGETLDALGGVEAELEQVLGGRGVLVGHQTHRGTRTLHVYTDGEDQNAEAALTAWAAGRGIGVESVADPGWSRTRHLLG